MIYDLIQEIEDAFCTGAPVLSSFGVLDPRNLPDTVEKLSDYGQVLIIMYQQQKEPHYTDVSVLMMV